jgi:hypothetical protein
MRSVVLNCVHSYLFRRIYSRKTAMHSSTHLRQVGDKLTTVVSYGNETMNLHSIEGEFLIVCVCNTHMYTFTNYLHTHTHTHSNLATITLYTYIVYLTLLLHPQVLKPAMLHNKSPCTCTVHV